MTLYEVPPETITVDDIEYPINTDFRPWITFQNALQVQEATEKKAERLSLLMEDMGLHPSAQTLSAMLEFYTGASTEHSGGGKPHKMVFDFQKDSEFIYSAFHASYGIDLTVAKLHWWRFKALFKSLPDDCEFCKIMRYRAVDMKDVPKIQKQFYREMKARYSLGESRDVYRTGEEMKDYARKRFEQARHHISE